MKEKTNSLIITIMISLVIVLSGLLTFSSIAFFKFEKSFTGSGTLPILKIDYSINTNNKDSLKNISYNGQESQNIEVKISTNGNNISGFVRIKVAIVWTNLLNNTPYDDSNEQITACDLNYDDSVWTKKANNYYYLNDAMEENQEIVFFSNILFGNLPEEYRGQQVSIYLITEIFQTSNLPENW